MIRGRARSANQGLGAFAPGPNATGIRVDQWKAGVADGDGSDDRDWV